MKMDLSWEEILHANHHIIQGANITKKILITIYFLFFQIKWDSYPEPATKIPPIQPEWQKGRIGPVFAGTGAGMIT